MFLHTQERRLHNKDGYFAPNKNKETGRIGSKNIRHLKTVNLHKLKDLHQIDIILNTIIHTVIDVMM